MSITSKALQIEDVKHVCIKFSKRVKDRTKPLHEDVLQRYKSCLRRDGYPKAMTSLFGVSTQ